MCTLQPTNKTQPVCNTNEIENYSFKKIQTNQTLKTMSERASNQPFSTSAILWAQIYSMIHSRSLETWSLWNGCCSVSMGWRTETHRASCSVSMGWRTGTHHQRQRGEYLNPRPWMKRFAPQRDMFQHVTLLFQRRLSRYFFLDDNVFWKNKSLLSSRACDSDRLNHKNFYYEVCQVS